MRALTIRISLLVTTVVIFAACGKSDDPTASGPPEWPPPDPVTFEVPDGFPDPIIPANNPLTRQGIDLGRRLYYDPILSLDSSQACGSCHQFGRAFSEPESVSVGINGDRGPRNAPQLTNAAWIRVHFWDGREASLEDQAVQPVQNPIEMAEDWSHVVKKIQRHSDYPDLFGRAFGSDVVTQARTVKAIAQFERTFISANSKYDRVRRGELQLTPQESEGFNLFFDERGDCFHCHIDIMFTDGQFHNIGLDSVFIDEGLGGRTGRPLDIGKFKTPTLRNVEFTAPYMHDGRFDTLEEVLNHYNTGGKGSATVDPLIRVGTGLGLSPTEVDAIIAFLKTLSDPSFINNPDLDNPFE